MARDNRAQFLAELRRVSPTIARAFEASIQDIRSTAQLRLLDDAIARGDIQAALRVLNLGAEFFAPLDRAIDDAFRAGAMWQISTLPKKPLPSGSGGPLTIRFDGRNPRAEEWVRRRAGDLIREIADDTRIGIAEVIEEGLRQGRGTTAIARDILGRMDGNSRRGGLLGLTAHQMGYVTSARAELADPARMADYLRRKRRDRSFDRLVKRAMKEGRAVSRADADKITARYSSRLLKLRSETIARTESLASMNAGRNEAMQQAIDRGDVPVSAVTKVWRATPSIRTRDTHWALNGEEVRFDQPFVSPSGAMLGYPGDASMGAGPGEIVNCRCSFNVRVNYAMLAR